MKQICKFSKFKDFKQSAPNLTVDLATALKDRVIPSTGSDVEHNNIESSDKIGMRVRDNFEAIEAQRFITAQGKAIAADEKAAKAAAENAKQTSTQTQSEGAN